jgi:hypothetical protein
MDGQALTGAQLLEDRVYWVANGELMAPANTKETDLPMEKERMHRRGYIKITHDASGTAVKWDLFAANWASMFFALDWISNLPGPYRLIYFLAGWFEEVYDTAHLARERMDVILGKSDIRLSRRTFVQESDPNREDMPSILKHALVDRVIEPDFAVDCVYDSTTGKFQVERVGPKSTIARLWGMSPVSYPCLTGHSYDQMVSRAYPKVMKTGNAHYDHVYAAMTAADGNVVWIPYQRVVLPKRFGHGKRGVAIVTEQTKVDIALL